jgi:alpha-tubulin suppressor-like RCC1 family protein
MGKVYAWGNNEFGALGTGEMFDIVIEPRLVEFPEELENVKIVKIFAAGDSSAAISSNGQVFVWGSNNMGQLGCESSHLDYPKSLLSTPTQPSKFLDKHVKHIAMGENTIMYQLESGEIYVAGMKYWATPFLFELKPGFQAIDMVCGTDYYAVIGKNHKVINYNGPFTGSFPESSDLPANTSSPPDDFFPSNPLKLYGQYGYCVGILEDTS